MAQFLVATATTQTSGPRSVRALELALAEHDPADLAGERLREIGNELDAPWIGIGREPFANERLDLLAELVRRLVVGREHDEGLHDVAAQLVRRGDRRRFAHPGVLEAHGLDLERADPVSRRDDHIVGPAFVPDVTVVVLASRVLRVEPLAAEHLVALVGPVPIAERVVRVRARAEADLASLSAGDRLLVLVEELDVPARHR